MFQGIQPVLVRHPWIPYVLPMFVYLLAGSLLGGDQADEPATFLAWTYPTRYTIQLALTVAAAVVAIPVLKRLWNGITVWGVVFGVVGVVLWVGLCEMNLEERFLVPIGLDRILPIGPRPSYNPLQALAESPATMITFVAIRFLGLALVIPVIEELFLRGFLLRAIDNPDFEGEPFGAATWKVWAVAAAYGVISHPETFAAIAWFSFITLLMVWTKRFWDCVLAHAVTNALLGAYVLKTGSWHLW